MDGGSSADLRYAALELRFCLEAITYEKLRAVSSRLPDSVLNKWQPPQAVKALLEYEPDSDKGFVLFAGTEEEYGKPSKNMQFIGEHKTFSLKWLRKHYNKLGGLLHFSQSQKTAGSETDESTTAYLREVLNDVENVLSSTIIGCTLATVHEFECSCCGDMVVCNKEAAFKSRRAQCLNPNCNAEYYAIDLETDNPGFVLMVTEFDCIQCKARIPIQNRMIDIGLKFSCDDCGTKHQIMDRQWSYGIVEK